MCRSVFPHWSVNKLTNENSVRNVSVSGCGNFSRADEDLNTLVRLATYLPRSLDTVKLLSLLCHYAFKDCSESSNDQNICLELLKFKNEIRLPDLIPLLEKILSNEFCLTIPKCARNFISSNDTNSNKTCPKPMVPTHTKYAREYGLNCSPPCDQSREKSRIGTKAFYVAMYASTPFYWISNVVVLITWAKTKNAYVKTYIYVWIKCLY